MDPKITLPEVVSPHLRKLIASSGGTNGPIGLQFIARPQLEKKFYDPGKTDPLSEEKYEVAPGLVYKYKGKIDKKGRVLYYGRVLWTITPFCASYCRFCTRGRMVGSGKNKLLSESQIEKVLTWLKAKPEINELIISGGDPLSCPQPYLTKIIDGLAELQENNDLDIIRLGTRLPVSNPLAVQDWHYQLLAKIKNPYLMVHINHPAELTAKTIDVFNNFRRQSLALVGSQSVLLKGVNDSEKVLLNLFNTLAKEGIRPYYIYQNDPVWWARHFTVTMGRAIRLWGKLRPKLSGVAATAKFVIDTPYGFGKIPLPEGEAWEVNYSSFNDFKKKPHKTV